MYCTFQAGTYCDAEFYHVLGFLVNALKLACGRVYVLMSVPDFGVFLNDFLQKFGKFFVHFTSPFEVKGRRYKPFERDLKLSMFLGYGLKR
jgi:hypothetical protein